MATANPVDIIAASTNMKRAIGCLPDELCYTDSMQARHYWNEWAQFLHQRGLNETCALFMEALGPLLILFAQFTRIGQPLLELSFPVDQIETMARMLEDQEETRSFIVLLREDTARNSV